MLQSSAVILTVNAIAQIWRQQDKEAASPTLLSESQSITLGTATPASRSKDVLSTDRGKEG
jgi:hypothetical protein